MPVGAGPEIPDKRGAAGAEAYPKLPAGALLEQVQVAPVELSAWKRVVWPDSRTGQEGLCRGTSRGPVESEPARSTAEPRAVIWAGPSSRLMVALPWVSRGTDPVL